MKKITFLLCFYTAFFIANAQNPKLIKNVQGASISPTMDQSNWRNNYWNGSYYYASGTKLCKTDGTATGTDSIKSLGASIKYIFPANSFFYIVTNTASFSPSYNSTDELWISNGTAAGTTKIYTFPTITSFSIGNNWVTFKKSNKGIIGNTIFFAAYTPTTGKQLWKSDGTAAGTVMVKVIKSGGGDSYACGFSKVGNKVVFGAASTGYEVKLWETDGTDAGTQQIPVQEPFYIVNYTLNSFNNKVVFFAHNTVDGYEPYISDGTAAGTFMLKNINPSGNSLPTSDKGLHLKNNSKYCFFIANNGTNSGLWRTDGTNNGTIQLNTIDNNISDDIYSDVDETGIYYFDGTSGTETLVKSDATVAGTMATTNKISYGQNLKIYKGAAWFQGRDVGSAANVEPWRSDGLTQNTNKALEVAPGNAPVVNTPYSSNPNNFFTLNNKLYFFADDYTSNRGLYEYTGDFTYNGSLTGGRWRDSANWNSMLPPGITDTVFINVGTPNALNINGSNAYAGVLQLGNNASLTLTNTTDSLFINNKLMSNSTNSFTGNGFVVTKNNGTDSVQLTNSFTANNLLVQSNTNLQAGTLTINNTLTLNNNGKLILNNNNAVLTGNTSTAIGNTTSYVLTNGTGKLTVQNMGAGARTSAINFPIGTTDFYNPVQITNSGTADAFSARVQPQAYGTYSGETGSGNPYQLGAVNATWFITEENAGGSNTTINLQWNASQELVGFDRNATTLAHYTGGAWSLGGISAASGTNPYNYSRAGITSFSPFAIMNNNASLGIRSVKLSVVKQNNTHQLSWNIVATDADKIDIQKSNNGISFNTIHTQNFIATNFYADAASSGKNYYRLRVMDKTGNYTYSNIVMIDDKGRDEVQVYPTIFTTYFTVQNNNNNNLELQLFDLVGKLVFQKTLLQGTNIITTETLSKQTYYYQIKNNSSMVNTGKIIKQ